MCGIFGFINADNNAADVILAGLKKLEYRGYDSWGIVVKPGKKEQTETLKMEKHVGKISQAQTSLPHAKIGLGHTRWATHGGVTDANAHPHFDCSNKIAVVHNGIIENFRQLKSELSQQGHKFQSETDSEIVAHLIEERRQDSASFKQALFDSFAQLQGSNAIAVLDQVSEKIGVCRDGSPLIIGIGNDQYYLASDASALLSHTKKVVYLEDQQGAVISKSGVKVYDLKTGKKVKLKTEILDWDADQADKKNYPHYLIKEIFEQQEIIPHLTELNQEVYPKLKQELAACSKILLLGCGTAYHVAKLGSYYFAKQGYEAHAIQAHEFKSFADWCDERTLVLAISQSGETADTLLASKLAQKKQAKLVSLVNAKGSTLERLADLNLKVGAGPEIAVVSTKASTAQLINLYLAASLEHDLPAAKTRVKDFAKSLQNWLTPSLEKRLRKIAKDILREGHSYVIGKKFNYPAALEFALKIKETSYQHAEGFAASELKHGVISLISKDTPCFVLSDQSTHTEVVSSGIEVKSRGGKIIGVGPDSDESYDEWIKVPEAGDLTSIFNIIVGQMLGYLLGVGRGVDPDKPRNLAKSVTVK